MNPNVDHKITCLLEMASLADLSPPARSAPDFELRQVNIPCPEYNWFLYEAVGVDYRWGGREGWGREEWHAYVDRLSLETWVAYVRGAPAGYYELERQGDGSVCIECFGLRGLFLGQDLGGTLLCAAVERCWAMGANRIWLRTCSHDHPYALQNYLARGFKLVRETVGPPDPQRESVLFTQWAKSP